MLREPVPSAYRPQAASAPPNFVGLVASEIARRLSSLEAAYAERGSSLAELGSASDLAERMLAAVPSPSLWNDVLGPFYGSAQVARLLGGISRQAVADRRERGTLLGLKTADGAWVYPTFQFGPDNEVLPGLAEVTRILAASGIDEWTLAGWLTSSLAALGNRTPIAWLRERQSRASVLACAHDAARRFAS